MTREKLGRVACGSCALRAGVERRCTTLSYYACRDKLLKEPQNGPTRRAIVLLSDGEDNAKAM